MEQLFQKTRISFIFAISFCLLLSSCFKGDDSVILQPPGDAEIFQVSQGSTYHRQQYFDMATQDTMGSEHDVWDLAFEAGTDGWHIWINGGNLALIANSGTQDFDGVTDTSGAVWKWDATSWNADSTAIGDWRDIRMVYILDRGYEKPASERFKKIIFQSEDGVNYEIQFSDLDGNNKKITDIPKNSLYSYSYFTFDNGGMLLDIEPDKQNWDVLFTRYRYIFYDQHPPLPYLVTGVLINPEISVAVDSTVSFSSINYQKATTLTYSNSRDIIGWNWKHFDFTSQLYVVHSNINYIIKDAEGIYWKLHFIDFYDEHGEKGYPEFEYQRL